MYMNVTMLISVMGITTPKPTLKLAHRRINAIVGSSLKLRLNLLNMRSSMQAKPGLVLTVVSSQRVMTKELCTSIIGHSMSTFDGCSVDGHPFGNNEQYMVWWHMQEDHGLHSPLGCPKCDGTFCAI